MFDIRDDLPARFLEVRAQDITEVFNQPTLIMLEGEIKEPVFISILLHGNEISGLIAVQHLFKSLKGKLPRSIALFVGNVTAAGKGLRVLENQVDYNRIWEEGQLAENIMAMEVMNILQEKNVFCALDIHNTNGQNPVMACTNYLEDAFFFLASHFSDQIMYFTNPQEVCANAFGRLCPSLTLECGVPGDLEGIERCHLFLSQVLDFKEIPDVFAGKSDLNIYQTVVKLRINEGTKIDFFTEPKKNTLVLRPDWDSLNFTDLEVGMPLGWANREEDLPQAYDNRHNNVTKEFFELKDGKLLLKHNVTPSLLLKNEKIIRQDCLGYFMRRIHIH